MSSDADLLETMKQVLRRFQASTPGIVGSAVVSADGFTIACELPTTIEEERNAAMAAALLALGQQTTHEFERGSLRRVFVEGDGGHVIVVSAGPEALLSAVARPDTKLGLVFLQMSRAAEDIRHAMEG
jgi:predicted regulator of Ras-like GTPase activity (Roadblock/LC7/MglB family)